MRVGILGSGQVGQVLARGFASIGDEVRIGSRSGDKLGKFTAATGIVEGTLADVAAFGDMVVLAVAGSVAEDVVRDLAPSLAGKAVIDTTNPIAGPPQDGYLPYFTGPDASLMERLIGLAPDARFVKAFNSVGNAFMVRPDFGGMRPTMFICGADADAKAQVRRVLEAFLWDVEDVGGPRSARMIEALCQLWCAPGFLRGDWSHALAVLRR